MDKYPAPTLAKVVIERLDYLDRLATEGDTPSLASLAETEIARLTEAWRALLELHAPDGHGRCPECSGWRRPRRHPCTVWTTATTILIATDGSPKSEEAVVRLPPDGLASRC
ncbi:hypothetical protein [Actinophytocola sp.]|uniref:hypothetical protein n=1 Tax=Actinophytocola sp. TaxID=1872138 RepID=UPI00389B1380